MRKKVQIVLVMIAVLCVISTGVSLFFKTQYKDFNQETNAMDHFSVGLFPEGMIDAQIKSMDAELKKKSQYIAAVTCQETPEFLYCCISQKVQIRKVFQGKTLKAGDVIDLVRGGSQIYEDGYDDADKKRALNLNFVNVMKPGKTYLVFMEEKIKNSDRYITSADYLICPIFSYEISDSKAVPGRGDGALYASYEDVKENEWFFTSRKDIEKMQTFRKKLLKQYPFK